MTIPRRILVDASTLRSGGGPIIAAHEIAALAEAVEGGRVYVVSPPQGLAFPPGAPAIEVVRPIGDPGTGRGFLRWNAWEAAWLRRRLNADAVVSFTNWLPVGLGVPSALYVHSPYSTRFNLSHFLRKPAHLARFLASQAAFARADVILVQTRAMKAEVERTLPVVRRFGSPPSIRLAPPTGRWMADLPSDPAMAARLERERSRAGLWLFYPSLPWRHKNMEGLAEALGKVAQDGVRVGLVLPAGGIEPEAAREGAPVILSFEGLSLSEMAACYDFADAVIFPSLMETAGLGLVEALARGRALLASNRPFVDELCDDAPVLFDPASTDDIAGKIVGFARNQAMRRQAVERAQEWRESHEVAAPSVWRAALEELAR